MNVCISIAEHELEMAHRWFDWVCELGGTDGHYLYLIPSAGVDISDILKKKAFNTSVVVIKDEEEVSSDWQSSELVRSAAGPNSAFRQVAWHFHHANLGPYFWCELDCIPLRKDWLDRLETEYKSCGKPFMGAHVLIKDVQEHMSGNAIYFDPVMEAPLLTMRTNWTADGQPRSTELAFDVAGAKEVIPKAHWTNLIQHKFRFKGFESRAEFDAVIDPNAVVFHSDKSGSIYKYLRENLSGGAKALGESGGIKTLVKTEIESEFESQHPSSAWDTAQDLGACSSKAVEHPLGVGDSGSTPDAHIPSSVPEVSNGVTTSCETTVVNKTFTPSDDLKTVIKQNSVIKNGLPAMSPPWENREDTDRDIKMLCDALALFTKSPVYKGRVRQALREAKIIK